MDAPPAQDSSKHILNALDTDCIEEILRKISNINDFLRAAQVCQQFQQSAKAVFHSKFQRNTRQPWFQSILSRAQVQLLTIRIVKREQCLTDNDLPVDCVEEFLCIFGSQLNYLSIYTTLNRENDDNLLKLIAKFAGKSLKGLQLNSSVNELNKLNVDFGQTQFLALEDISLVGKIGMRNFKRCSSKLISLRISASLKLTKEPWFIQHMPRLVAVSFMVNEMTDNMLADFLSLNPQLEELDICCWGSSLSASVFSNICKYSKNLNFLDLRIEKLVSEDMNLLASLLKLTRCHIYNVDSIDAVINAFARANIPIESLVVDGNRFSGEHLMTINTLKMLMMTSSNKSCTVPEILLKTQPSLKNLTVTYTDGCVRQTKKFVR